MSNSQDDIDVELPNGRVTRVVAMDDEGYRMYDELLSSAKPNPLLLWDITARCIPFAAREEVRALVPLECAPVLALAMGVRPEDLVSQLRKSAGLIHKNEP